MDNKIEDLLEQLNRETGLHLEIPDGAVDDDTSLRLQELVLTVKDHPRRDLFWQNLLLGQMTREEMVLHSHRFHIDLSAPRVLFLVAFLSDIGELERSVLSTYTGIRDELIDLDERHAVIIKRAEDDRDLREEAENLYDMLLTEAMVMTTIVYDTPVSDPYDLRESLAHCEGALQLTEFMQGDRRVVSYDELGFEKLLFSVPREAAAEFLEKKAPGLDVSVLDNEMKSTITTLFKNELNIADTAKELFIHRNTLVYRLDKFEKQTGLDIRKFDDAVVCRVALILSGHGVSH